ncbi:hypothetical protein BV20DRAFT_971893 [Pilatotrama ljubarskyi]|nr:hypothetical protein BV20DRAFT_971893 [Pilatotrama ljubarskyi]
MSEYYDATFRWPHPGASDVIVTGSFDGWSCSHHLNRTPSGRFEGTFQVPWGDTVQYKYIVDGRWTTTDDQPTELDNIGNLNNVLRAPARPPTPKPKAAPQPEPAPIQEEKPAEETSTVGKVNGFVETARQAVVGMVEAIAPGTTETPAETPAAEKSEPAPAPEKPVVEEPTPAPAPTEPEPAVTEITTEAILPSSPAPVAPGVPVHVLPLSTEPPLETKSIPFADVSESKPLETTIVEGSTTAETAVEPAPAPAVVPVTEPTVDATATTAPAADVAASKPLETTIVEGSTTAETAVPAPAPAAESGAQPSTHAPARASGAPEKPATNGVAPAAEKAPAVNGTNGASTPTPKAATNGTTPATPASPTKTASPPGSNGTSPASTPAKEKRMRFPSLSSRSLHSRSRSSVESAGELGESANGNGSGHGKEKSGSVASRLGGTERQKRRTSLFGKIKDVFHHPKHEASS